MRSGGSTSRWDAPQLLTMTRRSRKLFPLVGDVAVADIDEFQFADAVCRPGAVPLIGRRFAKGTPRARRSCPSR
ncbi:MAG: hypothetical protein ACLSVD_12090 [Eggerthellaceae bacterium]